MRQRGAGRKIVIDGLDWASSEPKNLVTGEASGPLKFIREAVELPPLPEGAFTYAVFGDTQCYTKIDGGGVTNRGFTSCIDWILANKDSQNIVFVSHLGDIVDRPDVAAQWEAASAQMKRLDDAGMRYGVAVGNHDMTWGDVSVFSQYFPASRYESYGADYESFGGFIGTNFCKNAHLIKGTSVYDDVVPCDIANICGNNGNSLQLFSAGGEDFIVFHLQCSTPQPVVDWVDEKLTEYADRTAIIVDDEGLGLIQEGRPYHDFGDEINFGRMRCHRINSNGSTSAQSQWERCYSKHPNLMMVLSGHEKEVLSMQQTVRGDYGNDVVEVCMNYPETPDSDWMRIYRFVPSENKVYAYTLSPRLAPGYGKTCVGDEVDFTDGYDKDNPTYVTNRVHHFEIDRTKMRDGMTETPAVAFAAVKVNVCDGRQITGNAFKAAGIPDLAMVQKVNLSLVEEDGRDVLRVEYGILNDMDSRRSARRRTATPPYRASAWMTRLNAGASCASSHPARPRISAPALRRCAWQRSMPSRWIQPTADS